MILRMKYIKVTVSSHFVFVMHKPTFSSSPELTFKTNFLW